MSGGKSELLQNSSASFVEMNDRIETLKQVIMQKDVELQKLAASKQKDREVLEQFSEKIKKKNKELYDIYKLFGISDIKNGFVELNEISQEFLKYDNILGKLDHFFGFRIMDSADITERFINLEEENIRLRNVNRELELILEENSKLVGSISRSLDCNRDEILNVIGDIVYNERNNDKIFSIVKAELSIPSITVDHVEKAFIRINTDRRKLEDDYNQAIAKQEDLSRLLDELNLEKNARENVSRTPNSSGDKKIYFGKVPTGKYMSDLDIQKSKDLMSEYPQISPQKSILKADTSASRSVSNNRKPHFKEESEYSIDEEFARLKNQLPPSPINIDSDVIDYEKIKTPEHNITISTPDQQIYSEREYSEYERLTPLARRVELDETISPSDQANEEHNHSTPYGRIPKGTDTVETPKSPGRGTTYRGEERSTPLPNRSSKRDGSPDSNERMGPSSTYNTPSQISKVDVENGNTVDFPTTDESFTERKSQSKFSHSSRIQEGIEDNNQSMSRRSSRIQEGVEDNNQSMSRRSSRIQEGVEDNNQSMSRRSSRIQEGIENNNQSMSRHSSRIQEGVENNDRSISRHSSRIQEGVEDNNQSMSRRSSRIQEGIENNDRSISHMGKGDNSGDEEKKFYVANNTPDKSQSGYSLQKSRESNVEFTDETIEQFPNNSPGISRYTFDELEINMSKSPIPPQQIQSSQHFDEYSGVNNKSTIVFESNSREGFYLGSPSLGTHDKSEVAGNNYPDESTRRSGSMGYTNQVSQFIDKSDNTKSHNTYHEYSDNNLTINSRKAYNQEPDYSYVSVKSLRTPIQSRVDEHPSESESMSSVHSLRTPRRTKQDDDSQESDVGGSGSSLKSIHEIGVHDTQEYYTDVSNTSLATPRRKIENIMTESDRDLSVSTLRTPSRIQNQSGKNTIEPEEPLRSPRGSTIISHTNDSEMSQSNRVQYIRPLNVDPERFESSKSSHSHADQNYYSSSDNNSEHQDDHVFSESKNFKGNDLREVRKGKSGSTIHTANKYLATSDDEYVDDHLSDGNTATSLSNGNNNVKKSSLSYQGSRKGPSASRVRSEGASRVYSPSDPLEDIEYPHKDVSSYSYSPSKRSRKQREHSGSPTEEKLTPRLRHVNEDSPLPGFTSHEGPKTVGKKGSEATPYIRRHVSDSPPESVRETRSRSKSTNQSRMKNYSNDSYSRSALKRSKFDEKNGYYSDNDDYSRERHEQGYNNNSSDYSHDEYSLNMKHTNRSYEGRISPNDSPPYEQNIKYSEDVNTTRSSKSKHNSRSTHYNIYTDYSVISPIEHQKYQVDNSSVSKDYYITNRICKLLNCSSRSESVVVDAITSLKEKMERLLLDKEYIVTALNVSHDENIVDAIKDLMRDQKLYKEQIKSICYGLNIRYNQENVVSKINDQISLLLKNQQEPGNHINSSSDSGSLSSKLSTYEKKIHLMEEKNDELQERVSVLKKKNRELNTIIDMISNAAGLSKAPSDKIVLGKIISEMKEENEKSKVQRNKVLTELDISSLSDVDKFVLNNKESINLLCQTLNVKNIKDLSRAAKKLLYEKEKIKKQMLKLGNIVGEKDIGNITFAVNRTIEDYKEQINQLYILSKTPVSVSFDEFKLKLKRVFEEQKASKINKNDIQHKFELFNMKLQHALELPPEHSSDDMIQKVKELKQIENKLRYRFGEMFAEDNLPISEFMNRFEAIKEKLDRVNTSLREIYGNSMTDNEMLNTWMNEKHIHKIIFDKLGSIFLGIAERPDSLFDEIISRAEIAKQNSDQCYNVLRKLLNIDSPIDVLLHKTEIALTELNELKSIFKNDALTEARHAKLDSDRVCEMLNILPGNAGKAVFTLKDEHDLLRDEHNAALVLLGENEGNIDHGILVPIIKKHLEKYNILQDSHDKLLNDFKDLCLITDKFCNMLDINPDKKYEKAIEILSNIIQSRRDLQQRLNDKESLIKEINAALGNSREKGNIVTFASDLRKECRKRGRAIESLLKQSSEQIKQICTTLTMPIDSSVEQICSVITTKLTDFRSLHNRLVEILELNPNYDDINGICQAVKQKVLAIEELKSSKRDEKLLDFVDNEFDKDIIEKYENEISNINERMHLIRQENVSLNQQILIRDKAISQLESILAQVYAEIGVGVTQPSEAISSLADLRKYIEELQRELAKKQNEEQLRTELRRFRAEQDDHIKTISDHIYGHSLTVRNSLNSAINAANEIGSRQDRFYTLANKANNATIRLQRMIDGDDESSNTSMEDCSICKKLAKLPSEHPFAKPNHLFKKYSDVDDEVGLDDQFMGKITSLETNYSRRSKSAKKTEYDALHFQKSTNYSTLM